MRKKDIEKYANFTSNLEIQNSLPNWNLVNKYATIFILGSYLLSGYIQTLQAQEAIIMALLFII